MKKMPMYVFVREITDGDGSKFLIARRDQLAAIEGDGPSEVTVYKRVKTNKICKGVMFLEGRQGR